MSIFAVADTHLSFCPEVDKPMSVFGDRWKDHETRLKESWERMVSHDDTVIIAGDISWAIRLDEAKFDLDWIHDLPGSKILLKGNHDLWWNGINRLNSLYDDMRFLQNDSMTVDNICICGSRGWLTPDHEDYTEADDKIYRREVLRLEMSLEDGRKKMNSDPSIEKMVGFMHFPPASDIRLKTAFQELFESYGVKDVYYGHIHGEESIRAALTGEIDGIRYHLISLDNLNCVPVRIV